MFLSNLLKKFLSILGVAISMPQSIFKPPKHTVAAKLIALLSLCRRYSLLSSSIEFIQKPAKFINYPNFSLICSRVERWDLWRLGTFITAYNFNVHIQIQNFYHIICLSWFHASNTVLVQTAAWCLFCSVYSAITRLSKNSTFPVLNSTKSWIVGIDLSQIWGTPALNLHY